MTVSGAPTHGTRTQYRARMRALAVLISVVILLSVSLVALRGLGVLGGDDTKVPTGPGGQPLPTATVPGTGPNIGVINAARPPACATDKAAVQAAVDAYTGLEGKAPADEQALVPSYLRAPSEYWDVKDGVLVAQNPACA